ncbi:MAG TPA: sodium:solute symporter, partial [Verrucomicrobiota bacterium]|nr:sodium:solute symporter [Verrucomicrobiota bacterium]
DAVFPHFIATALPAGPAGPGLAPGLPAPQRPLSSVINCAATLILCDGYRRHVNPAADDRTSLRVLRWASLVIGLLGMTAALAMMQVKSALDAWWKLAGIGSGGVLGLFLLGRISRAGSAAAACATVAGVLVIAWMTFSPKAAGLPAWSRSPFHEFLISVFGTATVLLAGLLLGSRLRRNAASPSAREG